MQHTSRTSHETDIKDAQWIFELLQHGLVRASFILLRLSSGTWDLVRHRANFIRERVNLDNRVQKVLEAAISLGCVASDVMGASGRAMLRRLWLGKPPAQR